MANVDYLWLLRGFRRVVWKNNFKGNTVIYNNNHILSIHLNHFKSFFWHFMCVHGDACVVLFFFMLIGVREIVDLHEMSLTLIPISFFPTYSLYHALVTRYLNNMNHIFTIFLARGSSDSVAKRITRQTSDREDCSSNPPGGECIYSNVKKLDLSGICTRISCVEARCPNHITNA